MCVFVIERASERKKRRRREKKDPEKMLKR